MANTPQSNHRISGYLEKKAKLRLGSPWKKYWFVLEGRLLLYYRSKDEYESLSPCKGSINLCPPCNVKPAMAVSGVFQIECRASTIILRAEDRSQQEQWMQSLLSVIAQTQSNSSRMSHFRYSLDDLPIPNEKPGRLCRQNTMPHRNSPSSKEIIGRLQKIGAQTYRVTSGAIALITKKDQIHKSQSAEQLPQYSMILEEKNDDIGVSVENEQYVASAEGDEDNHIRAENQRNENPLYDRCSRQSLQDGYSTVDKFKDSQHEVINDQYVITDNDNMDDQVLYCAIDNPKEALYEDPYNFKSEPLLPPRPDVQKHSEDAFSQASSNEDTNKRKKYKFLFRHLRKYDKKLNEEFKSEPKSRPTSFLKRVWKRKSKSPDSQDDVAYEAIEYEVIEKRIQQNKNDLQMLQELQDILESRKCIVQERLKSNSQRAIKSAPPNVAQLECGDKLKVVSDRKKEEAKPTVPPKQLSPSSSSTLSPTDSLNNNEIKSIDEILEDLDKETEALASKQKVKELIEKFEVQNEDDVKMRPKSKQLHFIIGPDSCSRHSEGLNELLEKLCKVTCAPVLKPGVTTSLVTPALTDEEWLKVMPIRNRRLSEPDYDIPRPHRSLHLQTPAKTSETPINATRFFGPILIADTPPRGVDSKPSTMDPDSLEVDRSHTNTLVRNKDQKDDLVIYAEPKSLSVGVQECAKSMPSDPNCDKNTNEELEDTVAVKEEIFVDSLEPLVEISTIF